MTINKKKLFWFFLVTLFIFAVWYSTVQHYKINAAYYRDKYRLKVCQNRIQNLNHRLNEMKTFVKNVMKMIKKIPPYLTKIGVCIEDIHPAFVILNNFYRHFKQAINGYVDIDKYMERFIYNWLFFIFYHQQENQVKKEISYYTNKLKRVEEEIGKMELKGVF